MSALPYGRRGGRVRALALCLSLMVILSEPAVASTLPRLDLQPGQLSIATGLLDAGAEVGLTDRWSLGAGGNLFFLINSANVHTTVRLYGEPDGVNVGLTLSGGYFRLTLFGTDTRWYIQPAAVASLPLGRSGFTLRGSLGPSFSAYEGVSNVNGGSSSGTRLDWVPNLEIAYRINRSNELTIGGNSLIGWRGTFSQ